MNIRLPGGETRIEVARRAARFDAVAHQAAPPPGDDVVEVDDNRIPFPAAEGDVLELTPQ